MDAEARKERVDGLLVLLEFLYRRARHQPIAQAGRDKNLDPSVPLAQPQKFDLRAGDVGRIPDPRLFDNLLNILDPDARLVGLAADVLRQLGLELRLVVAPR